MTINRQWLLAAHPKGRPLAESDFSLHEAEIPEPGNGEILVQTHFLAFEPAQKSWMENIAGYMAPMSIGEVMRGHGAGRVIASNAPGFSPGDGVAGMWGWQDYALVKPSASHLVLEKIPPERPLTSHLSVLGVTGLTAFFGMTEIGRPFPGDTVVISGAAGATGSIAGQLAKIGGCRVIGIAGGRDKCDWLTGQLGFDGAIDYKSEVVRRRLKELCPTGIDVFYDNVGGPILNDALARLAMRARVVICGGISRYEQDHHNAPGPGNYFNLVHTRSRMEGFLVLDYVERYPAARQRLWRLVEDGKLRYQEDIQEGFENAPRTLMGLFEGRNFGKQLLKVA